jgi:hypothetical protein
MNQIHDTLSENEDECTRKRIVQASRWTCTAGVRPWHAEDAQGTNSRPCTIYDEV